MPYTLKSLTPNLIVSDVARSVAFYRDTLGFEVNTTVPEQPLAGRVTIVMPLEKKWYGLTEVACGSDR
jgi:catechol 2,3-dioxygenase-like lactoylglutathione lyase family enzyme